MGDFRLTVASLGRTAAYIVSKFTSQYHAPAIFPSFG